MKVPEEGMSAEKPSGPGFDLAFYFSSPSFLFFIFILFFQFAPPLPRQAARAGEEVREGGQKKKKPQQHTVKRAPPCPAG